MNKKTKAALLDRVFRLNRDVAWNTSNLESQRALMEDTENILIAQKAERTALIEDLQAAGVEVDVPVQD